MSQRSKDKKELPENEVEVKDKKQPDALDNGDMEKVPNDEVDELQKAQMALQEEKERFLRLFAEFENFKKRTSKERIELFKTAGQDIMTALLPVLDDFDRALKEIGKAGDENLLEGVRLISNKLKETLRAKGLEPIGTSQGDAFDAEIHEAVTQIPAPSDELKGKVVDVIEKGYRLGDRIIRYPKVVTGQ